MTSVYDTSNIFAKIIRGEIPCNKVFETDEVLAFMDVMPQAEGHLLVVPKTPSRNLLDAEPNVLGPLMAAVQKLSRAAKSAFDADGISIMQFNEAAGGQSVFHLHFHILPRHAGVALKAHGGDMEDGKILAANAEKVRRALERS
jgi:histidine triad (HIT) family protein